MTCFFWLVFAINFTVISLKLKFFSMKNPLTVSLALFVTFVIIILCSCGSITPKKEAFVCSKVNKIIECKSIDTFAFAISTKLYTLPIKKPKITETLIFEGQKITETLILKRPEITETLIFEGPNTNDSPYNLGLNLISRKDTNWGVISDSEITISTIYGTEWAGFSDSKPNSNTDIRDMVWNARLNKEPGGIVVISDKDIDWYNGADTSPGATITFGGAIYKEEKQLFCITHEGIFPYDFAADSRAELFEFELSGSIRYLGSGMFYKVFGVYQSIQSKESHFWEKTSKW